jgi:hypothetical protein
MKGRGKMGNKDEVNMILKGLMQGADIPLTKVKEEICPDCEFHNGMCDHMMKLHLSNPESGISFVCKGMRHWITKTN